MLEGPNEFWPPTCCLVTETWYWRQTISEQMEAESPTPLMSAKRSRCSSLAWEFISVIRLNPCNSWNMKPEHKFLWFRPNPKVTDRKRLQGSYAIYAEIFFMKLPTQLLRHNAHTGETAAVRLKEIFFHAPSDKLMHIIYLAPDFPASAVIITKSTSPRGIRPV